MPIIEEKPHLRPKGGMGGTGGLGPPGEYGPSEHGPAGKPEIGNVSDNVSAATIPVTGAGKSCTTSTSAGKACVQDTGLCTCRRVSWTQS